MIITYISVEQWINSLELTIDSDWRPWFVDGQIAGWEYTKHLQLFFFFPLSLSLYLEWCYNYYKSFTTEILRIDMLVVKQKIK